MAWAWTRSRDTCSTRQEGTNSHLIARDEPFGPGSEGGRTSARGRKGARSLRWHRCPEATTACAAQVGHDLEGHPIQLGRVSTRGESRTDFCVLSTPGSARTVATAARAEAVSPTARWSRLVIRPLAR